MPFAAVGAAAAVASAGMDIYSGISAGGAANKASAQQQAAINAANNSLGTNYGAAEGYLSPYASTGTEANSLLKQMMTNPSAFQAGFQASPGYQYNLQQQQGAINNSAAARGGLAGGNTLMALQNNASGLADQDYQQYISNLMSNANMGMSADQGIAQLQAQYGQNISNNLLGIGASQSAATVTGNNAMNSGISGAIGNIAGITPSQYQGLGNALGSVFAVNQGPVTAGQFTQNTTPGLY